MFDYRNNIREASKEDRGKLSNKLRNGAIEARELIMNVSLFVYHYQVTRGGEDGGR